MTIHLKLQQKPTPTWTDAHLVSGIYTPPYIVANSPATFRFLYTNVAGDTVVSASGITDILCEVWSSQSMKTGGQDGILIAPAAVSVTTAAPLIADWNAATGSYYTATVTMTATETAAAITVMDDDASGLQGWMEVRGTLGGQNVLLGSGPLMIHKGSTGGTPPDGPDTYYTTADADAAFTKLAFKTIAVAGQSDIVADALDDTLTIVAGSNITLTTSGDTLTITSAGGGGGGGSGDVVGPSSAVNNRVVFFDGTTGKLIKDSGITLSGSNTGDQTSISGITGTTAQFNTALSDGDFATLAGSEALTNKTVNGLTVTTSTGTLTITNGKTLTASNTLTLAGTDASTLNIGTGGTLGSAAYTASSTYGVVASPLSQFAATTSTQLRGVISDWTGTGALVFAGGNIGAATATSLAATGNITTSGGGFYSGTANTANGSLTLYGDSVAGSISILSTVATMAREWDFPDADGTFASQEWIGQWTGSSNISTIGTVATGTWSATTIAVDKGGTGRTSHTAYAVLCGGTTGTGAQQSIASVGTAGQVLKSAGAGALPAFADDFYTVQATFDGGGAAISAGKLKGFYTAPMAGTIDGGSITVDTGTLTFKVWKIATGTAKPTTADNISGSGLAISTGTHKAFVSGDLSGFSSTAVAAGDIFAFEILSPGGSPTEGTVAIKIKKS